LKEKPSGRYGQGGRMIDAVIVAAGEGMRMGGIQKQFLDLEGRPIVYYSVRQFYKYGVDKIILVVPPDKVDYSAEMVKDFHGSVLTISGGERRQDSVLNGLNECDGDIILVHDGVRPFVKKELIEKVIKCAQDCGACAPGIPINDTVKLYLRNRILWTKGRGNLLQIQTPQAFNSNMLKHLLKLLRQHYVNDELSLIECLDEDVCWVFGDPMNIKITYPEDIELARVIAKSWRVE